MALRYRGLTCLLRRVTDLYLFDIKDSFYSIRVLLVF
nr:MAG TPA: hypothetical protein [Caudoviricetes sp.]